MAGSAARRLVPRERTRRVWPLHTIDYIPARHGIIDLIKKADGTRICSMIPSGFTQVPVPAAPWPAGQWVLNGVGYCEMELFGGAALLSCVLW